MKLASNVLVCTINDIVYDSINIYKSRAPSERLQDEIQMREIISKDAPSDSQPDLIPNNDIEATGNFFHDHFTAAESMFLHSVTVLADSYDTSVLKCYIN